MSGETVGMSSGTENDSSTCCVMQLELAVVCWEFVGDVCVLCVWQRSEQRSSKRQQQQEQRTADTHHATSTKLSPLFLLQHGAGERLRLKAALTAHVNLLITRLSPHAKLLC